MKIVPSTPAVFFNARHNHSMQIVAIIFSNYYKKNCSDKITEMLIIVSSFQKIILSIYLNILYNFIWYAFILYYNFICNSNFIFYMFMV